MKSETTKQEVTPEKIMQQIGEFATQERNATSRRLRCEELMRRKIAKSWDEKKKLKMVRRLMSANKQIEQADQAIVQLREKLEELKNKA